MIKVNMTAPIAGALYLEMKNAPPASSIPMPERSRHSGRISSPAVKSRCSVQMLAAVRELPEA
jgi:hypothetical protein